MAGLHYTPSAYDCKIYGDNGKHNHNLWKEGTLKEGTLKEGTLEDSDG
jgi:hypothetical protein